MAKFSNETKVWLRSIIKQRKVLIRLNKSHKSHAVAALAIYRLEALLNCWSYNHDVYMGRFIRQYSTEISDILPGTGSTCHDKRMAEFTSIRKQALLIEAQFTNSINNCILNTKIRSNELALF
jgi:hypothetical protein